MTVHTKADFTHIDNHTAPVVIVPALVWNELFQAVTGRVTESDGDLATLGYMNMTFWSAATCVIVTPTTLTPPRPETLIARGTQ